MIEQVIKFSEFVNETSTWDPFKAITYKVEVDVLFEGFDTSTLKFKILLPPTDTIPTEYIKSRIDDRLKVFNNIVRYEIIKTEEATGTDRILPMM